MKPKNILIIILCLVVTSSLFSQSNIITVTQSNNTITIDFTLPAYTIADTNILEVYGINQLYKYIKIDNFGETEDIGYPGLPYFTVDLTVPSDADNFTSTFSNSTTEVVSLNKRILPAQDDIMPDASVPSFSINESYYNTNGSLSSFTSVLTDTFIIMSYRGISYSIFPFLYNPSTNRLTLIKSGRFTLTYNSSQLKSAAVLSNVGNDYLKSVFQNYSGGYLKSGSTKMGTYLIITAPRFEAALLDFVNHKRSLGYVVNLVNTNLTGTSATNIKNYIKSQYISIARPDFVLLVGDIGDIPASGGNASGDDINDPLTDLWYAAIDGGDYFADLFLGRFSISSVPELQSIIRKTIQMENNLQNYDQYAVFLAGGGQYQEYFDNGHNRAINGGFEPTGYSCEKIYAKNGGTRQQALIALNNNPIFYIYSGHGNQGAWGTPFDINATTINNATNSVYPFVFSFACLTGNFGYSANIGESWIRSYYGGVCYFGSSVNSNVNSDKKIEKEILRDAFPSCERLSPMINLGLKKYYKDKWSFFGLRPRKRYMKAYNLLGDPSLFYRKNCIENKEFTSNTQFDNGEIITYYVSNNIIAPSGNVFVIVNPSSNVTFIAGNLIKLASGFSAKSGSNFQARIENFCSSSTLKSTELSTKIENTVLAEKPLEMGIVDHISVFPNPFKDIIQLSSSSFIENEKIHFYMYDIYGKLIKDENIEGSLKESIMINTSDIESGVYFYHIVFNDTTFTGRIIKLE